MKPLSRLLLDVVVVVERNLFFLIFFFSLSSRRVYINSVCVCYMSIHSEGARAHTHTPDDLQVVCQRAYYRCYGVGVGGPGHGQRT